MTCEIIYFNWLCPSCGDRFDSDYKSLIRNMCIYCDVDTHQQESNTRERNDDVKRRLSFGTSWSCPTYGCVSGIGSHLEGETVCYDCLLEENRLLYEASETKNVTDSDPYSDIMPLSAPNRLHRQHACRYFCSVCNAPTSNSCRDCSTHCNCR
jgi:hypothetical protein